MTENKWRCSQCKRKADEPAHYNEYPVPYHELRCQKCGAYGLERQEKKGEWILVI